MRRRRAMACWLAIGMAVVACSDDDAVSDPSGGTAAPTATTVRSTTPTTAVATTVPSTPAATTVPDSRAPARLTAEIEAALGAAPDGCDPLDTRSCYLPYPSNAHTTDDPATETGRRVALPARGAPVNAAGMAVDVAEWNRNDGFSPSSTILTHVADLDADASRLPPWTDVASSLEADATVVLLDLDTGERVPVWAEPDAGIDDPSDALLVVQPAISLAEGHTFAVALRGLVTTGGERVGPSPVFAAYRDRLITELPAIEARRPEMEAMFDGLAGAGIDREGLVLAWTFTVASSGNITERMLSIRDETLDGLGEAAPEFSVTEVIEAAAPPPGTELPAGIARQVRGTFRVPNYLTGDGGPGQRFRYAGTPAGAVPDDPDALPVARGMLDVDFACNIAAATMAATRPAHLVQYGHGLLGSFDEVDAGNIVDFSNEYNAVYCATKWAGMSADDIPNAATTLAEFGNFPTMADRLQQGVLNQIVLGRLMLAGDGFVAHPAFARPDGSTVVDNSSLAYDGNSQGGIMGLMLAAVSTDFERAVLGVPGMNYSMLLPRSVDFDTYEAIMEPAYPNPLERTLIIALVQMLWDRGEGAGYVQHVTADPLAGTPAKTVLLHVAFGDQQVTELSAFTEARTLGIPVHRPVTADGRSAEKLPGWGLDRLTYPSDGSAIVVWDSGSAPIPFDRVPPRRGRDSHEDPRADPDVRRQKASFLFAGTLIDVCAAAACTADQRD